MKTLSEFLEVPEAVEFKFEGDKFGNVVYKIIDNELLCKIGNEWEESFLSLQDVVNNKIIILPQQLLTDEEKEYLKVMIKPFKDRVILLEKDLDNNIIIIYVSNAQKYPFILLTEELQFKNMGNNKPYTLADLGLEV